MALNQRGSDQNCHQHRRRHRKAAELQRSEPSLVQVSDVAMRWGFSRQSRFAQQYREQFGELPRETLHASAGG
ncbi:helix-turn-helix domain-containing protein [Pseudonocardia alaniniphila]|uniref:helix-turn-helix domain-containing protein n=1 Tax=Pseudonocardia alaniniphila TaxID=75291 RepID=UPI0024028B0E|nr:helix-turn-helix domain-containing protein [Pseudonocardia alaniniphila]